MCDRRLKQIIELHLLLWGVRTRRGQLLLHETRTTLMESLGHCKSLVELTLSRADVIATKESLMKLAGPEIGVFKSLQLCLEEKENEYPECTPLDMVNAVSEILTRSCSLETLTLHMPFLTHKCLFIWELRYAPTCFSKPLLFAH
jgi:hypothetical protein